MGKLSGIPPNIKDLKITQDSDQLQWSFTIQSPGALSLSVAEELTLIKTSPSDRARITYQSRHNQSSKFDIHLKPGKKDYSKTINLSDLEHPFADAVREILEGSRSSYPKWQLKLSFEKDGQILESRVLFLSAPEKWFWSFENPV